MLKVLLSAFKLELHISITNTKVYIVLLIGHPAAQ